MKKILLATDSQLHSELLNQRLSDHYLITYCSNGYDALDIAKTFQPDVLVVDLFLSGIDGISLLELIRQSGLRPRVIAISSYTSDYVISSLENLHVDCLLRDTCNTEHLAARIVDVANWKEPLSLPGRIDHTLATLGFKMNTSGYRITRLALELYIKKPEQPITSSLYPAVAAACGGTITQVEKAIRDSIAGAWKDRNEIVWGTYFVIGKNGKISKPSNGDFLARIRNHISEDPHMGIVENVG